MGQFAEEEWLGAPHSGDFEQGTGVSTAQLANPNTDLASTRPIATGPAWMQSPGVWAIALLALIGLKLLMEKGGEKSEFSSIRIGAESWVVIGLMSVTFLYAFRVSMAAWTNGPGALKQFAGAL